MCANCGREAPEGAQMYTMRIDMFARADPIVLPLEELMEDHSAKLADLVEQMEQMDADEAAAQVFERHEFNLCAACRGSLHLKLRDKQAGGL
jgi:hypothetical protein